MKKSSKVPNILVIQQSPDWGGAEEWMLSLVRYFHKVNISVHVATNYQVFNQKAAKISSSIKKIPFTLDIIGNFKGLIKSILLFPFAIIWYSNLLIHYKKLGVNCILMSGFSEKLLVTVLAKVLGIHTVWLEYGPLENVFKKNLYLPKVLYKLIKDIPESIITISQNSKQTLIKDAKISTSKLEVIYPGTKIPSKKPSYQKDKMLVGHLSRLSEEKGQRILIRSWKMVSKSLPKAKLIIAGDGPDKDYLINLAKKLKIDKSVEFVGFIPNKKEFYKKLSIFVFPSIWPMEGFGIVMIEALSFGIPVVAIDNGPAKEIIHKDIGRLSPSSPQKLADQIIGIIKAKQTNTQSITAYNEAKTKYNLDTQAQKVLDKIIYVIKN
jgi:glycosyltransferase involved in cell wall biosynthesis